MGAYLDELYENNEELFNKEYDISQQYFLKYKEKLLDPNYIPKGNEVKDLLDMARDYYYSYISHGVKFGLWKIYTSLESYRSAKRCGLGNEFISERYVVFNDYVLNSMRLKLSYGACGDYNIEFINFLEKEIDIQSLYDSLYDILDEEDRNNFYKFKFPSIITSNSFDYLVKKYVYDYTPE